MVQRRSDTDPYHQNKWKPATYRQYLPPGNPVRSDLAGTNEEVEDAFKAGQKEQQQWRALGRAWVEKIFSQGFGDKGLVKNVYQSEEDKDTGGSKSVFDGRAYDPAERSVSSLADHSW
ncbi:MAG TPA: hypothetical protein VM942_04680 [Acidimicrobiales bacterium]|nr:hypothetical protein [Acidimicrobiales bacterium]